MQIVLPLVLLHVKSNVESTELAFPMLDLSTEMAPPSQLKRAKNSGSADEQLVKWWHDFVTLTSDVSDIEEI